MDKFAVEEGIYATDMMYSYQLSYANSCSIFIVICKWSDVFVWYHLCGIGEVEVFLVKVVFNLQYLWSNIPNN